MKQILLILFIAFFTSISLQAQDSLHVSLNDKQMSRGIHTGFSVDVPQAKLKNVVNAWKKYIKRGETKSSVEKNGDEFQISGTSIANVSAKQMNVYATIKEVEKAIRITAYFAEDDSIFISSAASAEKAEAVEKLMKDFARTQYRNAVEDELKNETTNLSKLEREKEDLINDNEKANKNISEYERKIDRTKGKIETNDTEQSKRRNEVGNQKEIVRLATPNTETYDLEDKKLRSLEKELKNLEKAGENLHSDIDDLNSAIRKEKRNIEKTDDLIKEKKDAISRQKDLVKDVKEKLENIK